MKLNKRITAILLAVLTLVLLFPVRTLAAGSVDPGRSCTLTLSCRDGRTPLRGAAFSIYLVAAMDAGGALTVTEDFEKYHVKLEGNDAAAWRALAATLEGYVLRDKVTPADSGKTDRNGMLSFPTGQRTLSPGLYLVLGSRHRQNGRIYDAQPSMVLLPTLDKEADEWDYSVTVSPKFESHPEPTGPDDGTVTRKVLKVWKDEGHEWQRPKQVVVQLLRDGRVYDTVTLSAENSWRYTWEELDDNSRWTVVEKTPDGYTVEISREGVTFVVTNTWDGPDNPTHPVTPNPATPAAPGGPGLPQTGQLWWPVPLLLCAGLVCIVIGLLRRRGSSDEAQ